MKDTSQSSKGATADDAAALEELSACAAPIVEQNRHLARRAGCRDFNPSTELDFTSNGAGILIRRLFEAVALFDEGCVPWQRLSELFATTNALVNAIKLRKGAPVAEIDAVGVAFRECYTLWCDTHSPPRMERKTYLKQIFDGRNCVFAELKRLHSVYVKSAAAKGRKKRTLSAADVMRDDGDAEERRRIFAEIDRLRGKGMSVAKAISTMMRGSYAARMRGRKATTWARYYKERASRRTCRAEMQDAGNPAAVSGTDFAVPSAATTPETTPETAATTPETTPESISHSMALILAAIKGKSNITVADLAKACGLSKDGVKWNLRKLKNMNLIRRVGYTKGGHWEVGNIA